MHKKAIIAHFRGRDVRQLRQPWRRKGVRTRRPDRPDAVSLCRNP